MIRIDFQQYLMLRRARKFGTVLHVDDMTPEQQEICEYLCNEKLLKMVSATVDSSYRRKPKSYKITQGGKAEISAYVLAFHKWWIPLIIAIAAAIGAYSPLLSVLL